MHFTSLTCPKCGYSDEFAVGSDSYRENQRESLKCLMQKGYMVEVAPALLVMKHHPDALPNGDQRIFQCPDCLTLDTEPDLSVEIPAKNGKRRRTAWHYLPLCSNCYVQMRTSPLVCPKCSTRLKQGNSDAY